MNVNHPKVPHLQRLKRLGATTVTNQMFGKKSANVSNIWGFCYNYPLIIENSSRVGVNSNNWATIFYLRKYLLNFDFCVTWNSWVVGQILSMRPKM